MGLCEWFLQPNTSRLLVWIDGRQIEAAGMAIIEAYELRIRVFVDVPITG
ncbi:MAG: hypothetical protein ACKESB_01415 [Candidatus Hodgkinia cicadicola]